MQAIYLDKLRIMKTKLVAILSLLFVQIIFSQSILKGKIIIDNGKFAEIYVTNLSNNSKAIPDSLGVFMINAKPNQNLLISGPKIQSRKVFLTDNDFQKTIVTISISLQTTQLKEVTILEEKRVNAISLGIIAKDTKRYTQAERKVIEASSGLGIVQLLNAINGTTKRLKKELKIAKKIALQEQLDYLYPESYYTENLHIKPEYIKAFQLFAIEDENFAYNLKRKESTKIDFLLKNLSLKFNSLLESYLSSSE